MEEKHSTPRRHEIEAVDFYKTTHVAAPTHSLYLDAIAQINLKMDEMENKSTVLDHLFIPGSKEFKESIVDHFKSAKNQRAYHASVTFTSGEWCKKDCFTIVLVKKL